MARKAFLMDMRNVNEPEVLNVPPGSCRQDEPVIVAPMRRARQILPSPDPRPDFGK
jgi:hypothetical protein